MEQEAFYKDQYDKSVAARSEINGSLSTPIGILTALLAGLYFCVTNFDYHDDTELTWYFSVIAIVTAGLLLLAITYLILAFADFLKSRKYYTLNDASVLYKYFTDLVFFYTQNPPISPLTADGEAKKDFDVYLLQELIRNTTINQQTSRIKTALLFQSHKFMIYAIIALSLLIIPFGIDFGNNKGNDKIQKVRIIQPLPVNLSIKYQNDTIQRSNIKPSDHGQSKRRKTHTTSFPHNN